MDFITLFKAAQFKPDRVVYPEYWIGHIPFAAWLIQTVQPSVFVELGTHTGNSYMAFCQAVKEGGLQTRCYAVDTWQGDEHTGPYPEDVFNELNSYNENHYAGFSRLMRMTFDDAASYFTDGTIEILHIDGTHIYEAIKHDFETWLPKLAPHAVVLFHDTNVRDHGFGVWRFWSELNQQYPLNFEFLHMNGLGVIQISNGKDTFNIEWLNPNFEHRLLLREYFANLGQQVVAIYHHQETETNLNLLQKFSEKNSEELSNSQALMLELNQSMVTLQTQLVEREKQMATQEIAYQSLQTQINSHEQTISALEQINQSQEEKLAEHVRSAEEMQKLISEREEQLVKLKQDVLAMETQITEKEEKNTSLNLDKSRYFQELTDLKVHLNQREQILQDLNSKLLEIYGSTAWKLVKRMWGLRLWLAPKRSSREKFLRSIVKLFLKRNDGVTTNNRKAMSDVNAPKMDSIELNHPKNNTEISIMRRPAVGDSSNPLVSVVIPCFNDGEYLDECLNSIIGQTYQPLEIIIVDDGSTDQFTKLKLENSSWPFTSITSTPHEGPAKARNAGIQIASGKYILPVDADDKIHPSYIEKAVDVLEKQEKVGIVYCLADCFGKCEGRWNLPAYSIDAMLLDNVIFATALFRKGDWKSVGGYDDSLKHGMEDYDFWLSLIEMGKDVYQIPEVLFYYRIKENSRTAKFLCESGHVRDTYRKIYRNHPKLYAKYRNEYSIILRDALIDLIFWKKTHEAP